LSSYLLVPSECPYYNLRFGHQFHCRACSATYHSIPSVDQTSKFEKYTLSYATLRAEQILHYSEVAEERNLIENAVDTAEKILNHINETIREQEGTERLRAVSQELWIGQGYDIRSNIGL
jgi:hypothetical protein